MKNTITIISLYLSIFAFVFCTMQAFEMIDAGALTFFSISLMALLNLGLAAYNIIKLAQ